VCSDDDQNTWQTQDQSEQNQRDDHTRKTAGEKDKGHGDAEGEFDSTKITMKRWRDFEKCEYVSYCDG
jgi:hypothetical protein